MPASQSRARLAKSLMRTRLFAPLTPANFRAARNRLGLSQHEMAEALRMGKWGFQTILKWEKGKQPIPGPVTLAVECLLAQNERKERS